MMFHYGKRHRDGKRVDKGRQELKRFYRDKASVPKIASDLCILYCLAIPQALAQRLPDPCAVPTAYSPPLNPFGSIKRHSCT